MANLKLGVEIGQTSVAKYMVRRRDLPSQGWRTFLRNHADGIAAMDLFVVPTISFRLLYGLLIVGVDGRFYGLASQRIRPQIGSQIRSRKPAAGNKLPAIIRDRDRACGEVFIRRLRSRGIRDRPTSPRSPWQNGDAER